MIKRRRKLKQRVKRLSGAKFRRIRHIYQLHRRVMARQRIGFVLLNNNE